MKSIILMAALTLFLILFSAFVITTVTLKDAIFYLGVVYLYVGSFLAAVGLINPKAIGLVAFILFLMILLPDPVYVKVESWLEPEFNSIHVASQPLKSNSNKQGAKL